MATEREIENHKNTLLDVIRNRSWGRANAEMNWLLRNLSEKQVIDFFPEVLTALDRVIDIDRKSSIALTMRGSVKKKLLDHQGAIADFDKALELNPNNSTIYVYRGIANQSLNNYQEAIADFDKAIQINQNDSEAYSSRGFAKGLLGKHQEAIADFSKSIDLDSNNTFAYRNRGVSRNFLGEYKKAIIDFDNTIKLNPYDYKAYNYRGVAKALLENHQDAIADFNMAITINRNDAETYSNRGSAKDHLGDYQGAIDDYDNAINLQPDDFLYYHLKGLILLKIGDKQKAEESFMTFVEKKNKSDHEQDEKNLIRTKRGKKSNKDQLYQKLDDIPDEWFFLKSGRDRIKGKSPHENVLYLYALLDHAMRNTLCYIAVVNLKCNFELTKEHLGPFRYDIMNFEDKVKGALVDTKKYPKKESSVMIDLNVAIQIRHRLAHGKKIGKFSGGAENAKDRWEAISGVNEVQCYKACTHFIDFFIEYLKFFDDYIQNKNDKRKNKFNPFHSNFQGFIGKRSLTDTQTRLILRGIGIIKSKDHSNHKNSKQSTHP